MKKIILITFIFLLAFSFAEDFDRFYEIEDNFIEDYIIPIDDIDLEAQCEQDILGYFEAIYIENVEYGKFKEYYLCINPDIPEERLEEYYSSLVNDFLGGNTEDLFSEEEAVQEAVDYINEIDEEEEQASEEIEIVEEDTDENIESTNTYDYLDEDTDEEDYDDYEEDSEEEIEEDIEEPAVIKEDVKPVTESKIEDKKEETTKDTVKIDTKKENYEVKTGNEEAAEEISFDDNQTTDENIITFNSKEDADQFLLYFGLVGLAIFGLIGFFVIKK